KIAAAVKRPELLAPMLDHVGAESAAKMLKQWTADGDIAKMDMFLDRLAAGGAQLGETSALGAKSIIIDSNTAIALMKDANPALGPLNAGEKARVAYIKKLGPGVELRVANVTVGEIQGGVLVTKGMPITVLRDSAEYKSILQQLEAMKLGGGTGYAD